MTQLVLLALILRTYFFSFYLHAFLTGLQLSLEFVATFRTDILPVLVGGKLSLCSADRLTLPNQECVYCAPRRPEKLASVTLSSIRHGIWESRLDVSHPYLRCFCVALHR